MTKKKYRPAVMCRSAVPPEPLVPTFALGYSCESCAKPLQVSPTGLKQIRDFSAQPLCNDCGTAFLRSLIDLKGPREIRINPAAAVQIEKLTGEPILDTFPDAIIQEEEE